MTSSHGRTPDTDAQDGAPAPVRSSTEYLHGPLFTLAALSVMGTVGLAVPNATTQAFAAAVIVLAGLLTAGFLHSVRRFDQRRSSK